MQIVARTGTGTKSGTGVRKKPGRKPGSGTGRKKKTGTGTDSGEQMTMLESGTGTGIVSVESGTGTQKKKTGRPKGRKSGYTATEKALIQRREAAVKAARAREGLDLSPEDAEYNRRHIQHVLRIHEIATHADRKDPASLRACFLNYVALCAEDGFKVGNMGAVTAMGVDIQTLAAWQRSSVPELRDLAKFVKSTCSLFRETLVADGKVNPVIGIFWQRNYDGLRNDTEQVQQVQPESREEDGMTADDYRKKYGDLIGE